MCVCVASALVAFPLGDMGWSVIMCVCVFASALVSFPLGDMGWSVIMAFPGQIIRTCHECEGGIEKIHSKNHLLASRGLPSDDKR